MGPVAWLRDLDGTGSLHVCAEGDPGAIAVFTWPLLHSSTKKEVAAMILAVTDEDGDQVLLHSKFYSRERIAEILAEKLLEPRP